MFQNYDVMKTFTEHSIRLVTLTIGLIITFGACVNEPSTLSNDLKSAQIKLTESEIQSLLFMVEEEKLARDVYLVMYEKYELQIFDNISVSEQTHVDAISTLLAKYNITNPTDNSNIGEFINTDLQQLYNILIELGNTSKNSAIEVGIIIEEKDIEDIAHYIEHIIETTDIIEVYSNLLNGSYNHLEAFESHIH